MEKIENDFEYTVENEKASITKYDGSENTLIIPNTLGGYEVTSIGEGAFFNCESLTSLEIPDSVATIGDSIFENCASLTSVKLPNAITRIGVGAFYACEGLASITIPDSVTIVDEWAFIGCSNLPEITIPDSVTTIGGGAFFGCESLKAINLSKNHLVYSFTDGVLFDKKQKLLHTFLESNKEHSYEIPDSVTCIGDSAFGMCNGLIKVEIPNSVTHIGEGAFSNCDNLAGILIPDSVISIRDSAFENCEILILTLERNSYAHKYAIENNIGFAFVKPFFIPLN